MAGEKDISKMKKEAETNEDVSNLVGNIEDDDSDDWPDDRP